jgi:glycosyltransferase involved in cell wall biosynthesis
MPGASRPIKVFTPSFADEADTNAQNLTVKEVAARLDPQRFHVTMFYQHEPDPRLASRPNTRLWRWQRNANTLRTLVRMLGDVPDIYFFPREGPLDEKFFQVRRWLGWNTAVVTYMVSGGLDRVAPRPGQLRNLREASAVYGNCRYLTELLTSKLGYRAETIHDGIDRRYYFPPETPTRSPSALTVLYAGSFRSYKRAELAVKQAARWPEVEFRLAGRGEEEEACRRLASELGCRKVRFLGHLGQAELGREMRNADVFLFPSELEGHPQVLLQAAGCGLPVIAMDSYHPDAVVNGQTGFLVSSEEDLAGKLERLLKDGSLRTAMSKASIEHASSFNWDRAAADWARAFENVAGRDA